MNFLRDNLVAIALAFGGGAMAVGSFVGQLGTQREIAELRQEIAVHRTELKHLQQTLDELRGRVPQRAQSSTQYASRAQ